MTILTRADLIKHIQILQEVKRREVLRDPIFAMRASLFPKQRAFFDDTSKNPAAVCSRRAGKSVAISAKLAEGAYKHPLAWSLYLALTRDSAKAIMWEPLLALLEEFQFKFKSNISDLEITLANNSKIKLVGADHPKIKETLRGPRRAVVCIDEAGSFGPGLKQTIEDSIEPSLMDLDGQLLMVGTPPPSMSGYFHDQCCATRTAKVHHWTVLDNPHIPNAKQYLDEVKRKRGWTDDNPTYLREYCGVWAQDWQKCVYKFLATRDCFDISKLPSHPLHWLIGLDLGWNDGTAFSVIGYHEDLPTAYVIHSEKHSHWIPSKIASHLRELIARFKPERIVADAGALGKSIVEEFRQRYDLPIEAAEKTDKNTWIELLNGDLLDGRLKIASHLKELHSEMMALQWDEHHKEMPGQPNDQTDSVLYPFRWCYHYWHREPIELTPQGSDAWAAQQEADMLESAINSHNPKEEW